MTANSGNPFLHEYDDVSEELELGSQASWGPPPSTPRRDHDFMPLYPTGAAAAGGTGGTGGLTLPAFWAGTPAAWFGYIEGQFEIFGIYEERYRFYKASAALGEAERRQIANLLAVRPPPMDAYSQLKARILQVHALDEYQRVEKLVELPPLGGQRPSELLAEMMQLCPADEEGSKFLRVLFLTKLPRDIRLVLSEDRFSPIAALAARADSMAAHSGGNSLAAAAQAAPVAAVEPGAAAIKGGRKKKEQWRKGASGRSNGPREGPWTKLGICRSHHRYRADAWECTPPCSWSGN